jgi:hypothetical protein
MGSGGSIRRVTAFAGEQGMKRAILSLAGLLLLIGGTPAAQDLADLMAIAKFVEDVPAFENDYVRVHYSMLEYPAAERRVAEGRPVVLYIHVAPAPGFVNRSLLVPPARGRPLWQPGVLPLGIRIEMLKPPPPPPVLGAPGTNPPRDAVEEASWDGGRLVVATFRSFDYGVGTGGFPSVTTFLSDGGVEVSSLGLRRRMLVQAGETFWFEARTQLTAIDDYPVGAAILQVFPR